MVARPLMPAGAKAKIGEFKDLIVSLIVDKETLSLPELTERMLAKTGYRTLFAEDTEEDPREGASPDGALPARLPGRGPPKGTSA